MRKIVVLFIFIASVIVGAYGADKKQIKQLKADIGICIDTIQCSKNKAKIHLF